MTGSFYDFKNMTTGFNTVEYLKELRDDVFEAKTQVEGKLARYGVSPEDHGAVGDGVTDDTQALAQAQAAADSVGSYVRLSPGKAYGITSPHVLSSSYSVMVGHMGRHESESNVTIKKLPGFSGRAAVEVGFDTNPGGLSQSSSVIGVALQGFRIDGNAQPGAGLYIQNLSVGSFKQLNIEDSQGEGVVVDGAWETTFEDVISRWNDERAWRITGTNRKVSNNYYFDCSGRKGHKEQLLIESHPSDPLLVPAHQVFFGGIFEFPQSVGDLTAQPNPLVRIEAGIHISFNGCSFPQIGAASPDATLAPCMVIGKSGYTSKCSGIDLSACKFQHHWNADVDDPSAILIENDVEGVYIRHSRLNIYGASRLLDVAGMTPNSETVVVDTDLHRDQIRNFNYGLPLSFRNSDLTWNSSDDEGSFQRVWDVRGRGISLGKVVGGSFQDGVQIGGGSDSGATIFTDLDPQLAFRTSSEIDAMTAAPLRLVAWDGVTPAPSSVTGFSSKGVFIFKSASEVVQIVDLS